jgi:hypothetical protein
MKLFKLDLMSLLFIVVIIGVAVTMTTQASDRSTPNSGMASISTPVQD